MKIYKYTLDIVDRQVVRMPRGANILSVGNQRGKVCLWALCNPDMPFSLRAIEIIGTGNSIPENNTVNRVFVGTAIVEPFVWHVFESVKK